MKLLNKLILEVFEIILFAGYVFIKFYAVLLNGCSDIIENLIWKIKHLEDK